MKLSVNVCEKCKENLSLTEAKFGSTCTNCKYFELRRVYTIEDYNNWLKK